MEESWPALYIVAIVQISYIAFVYAGSLKHQFLLLQHMLEHLKHILRGLVMTKIKPYCDLVSYSRVTVAATNLGSGRDEWGDLIEAV